MKTIKMHRAVILPFKELIEYKFDKPMKEVTSFEFIKTGETVQFIFELGES